MGWEHLVAFNITLLAAILSPGPAMLYFIRTTLAEGRRAGIFTVLGLGPWPRSGPRRLCLG
ncbi:hypothetical protein [Primorskyibacter sp. S187A]|uniref:hypothetical protein n=1 Tax=Primorskyibacter sp. S187A TaxID=3415130 RepID=UPI003C7CC49A